MIKKIVATLVIAGVSHVYAQVPEDALRMSWNTPAGTARSQAIGGAMGALGGDITAAFTNPAGLAVYKTSEMVITPGIGFLTNKSDFRGTGTTGLNKSNFAMGTSGVVFAFQDRFSNWSSKAFSIAINRAADFNGVAHYKGLNDFSSYSEQFLEEAAANRLDTSDVYDYPFTSGMAYYTYLIDFVLDDNGNFAGFKSMPLKSLEDDSPGFNQEKTITTSGGITEIALGFAANKNDKVYFGGSLGIPIMSYTRNTLFRESDASGDPDNNFNYSEYYQHYSSKGAGMNLKLGVIFKPLPPLRIGLGLHTPTLYGLSEKSNASMTTDTENYPPSPGVVSVTSGELNDNRDASFRYSLTSPWKFMVSGAYIFGQEADVRSQKGFVSADLEYVTMASSRFSAAGSDYYYSDDDDYYNQINDITKDLYKGTFNARIGGELKFNTLMVRAGLGYYGNPYRDKELEASRMNISTGVGYRNRGVFVDLTYVHQLTKNVDFPYRLADVANTYATIKGSGSNVLLTFGFKF